ncbi:MAG: hypothetical protein ABIE70_01990 [bacterium]
MIKPRVPTPSPTSDVRGTDIRIGDIDTAFVVEMDVDYSNGNIFMVALCNNGVRSKYYVYFSQNSGGTWTELMEFIAGTGYIFEDIAMTIVDGHCYVAYPSSTISEVRLQHCRTSDGFWEDFDNGQSYVEAFSVGSDDIAELELESTQDFGGTTHRLYLVATTTSSTVEFYWDDENAMSFTEIGTGVTDCIYGLDATVNVGFSNHWFYISYIDQSYQLNIDALSNGTGWSNQITEPTNSLVTDHTSITARNDSVFCLYECWSGAQHYCRCYNLLPGQDPYWNVLGDSTIQSEAPAITCRRGGGVAAVSYYYTWPKRESRFTFRPSGSSDWGTETAYTDYPPYWNRPGLQPLLGGTYGIIYITYVQPGRGYVYFDYSSCCVTRGDVNHDGTGPDIADLVYLVNYMFNGGPEPECTKEADVTGSGGNPDIADLVYLVNYMFNGGPPPIPCP